MYTPEVTTMTEHYVGVDVHKTNAQVDVSSQCAAFQFEYNQIFTTVDCEYVDSITDTFDVYLAPGDKETLIKFL
jgi:hypothetical protein